MSDDNKPVTLGDFKITMSDFNLTMGDFKTRMDNFEVKMDDFETKMDNFEVKMDDFETRMDDFESKMFTKEDHCKFVAHLQKVMFTKQDFERFMEEYNDNRRKDLAWMDAAMTEINEARQERILHQRQFLRMDDRIVDHEKRIRTLERSA